jgi:glucose/arabinose dehydrogenase
MQISGKNLRRGIGVLILILILFVMNMALPYLITPDAEPKSGFEVEVITEELGAATCLHWVDSDWLLVCDNEADAITMYRLVDNSTSNKRELVTGFQQPQGVLYDNTTNRLFVSDRGRLTRFDLNGSSPAEWQAENRTVLIEGVPAGNHQTNAINMASNGSLIWHSGSTCNVCDESDIRNAALLSVDPENGTHHVIATGVRNSFDGVLIPGLGYVFTDNGRDWEGESSPYEELNLLEIDGFYGWPEDTPETPIPNGSLPPVATFTPHSSANGIALRPASSSLPGGEYTVYVTTYGSWNAAIPTGSELIRVDLIADPDSSQGWRAETSVVVDELPGALGIDFHPNGDLYVAQHSSGRLLRISGQNI